MNGIPQPHQKKILKSVTVNVLEGGNWAISMSEKMTHPEMMAILYKGLGFVMEQVAMQAIQPEEPSRVVRPGMRFPPRKGG